MREANAMSAMQGPNIVCVYAMCLTPPALLMEKCDGSLEDYLELLKHRQTRIEIPLTGVKNIALGAAQGLRFIHEKGGIHRDVKPANLMLNWKQNQNQQSSGNRLQAFFAGAQKLVGFKGLSGKPPTVTVGPAIRFIFLCVVNLSSRPQNYRTSSGEISG